MISKRGHSKSQRSLEISRIIQTDCWRSGKQEHTWPLFDVYVCGMCTYRYWSSHASVCVWVFVHVCAHVPLCVCVREGTRTPVCMCEAQERICGILSFYYSLWYYSLWYHSLETEFLTEFKVRLAECPSYLPVCMSP